MKNKNIHQTTYIKIVSNLEPVKLMKDSKRANG